MIADMVVRTFSEKTRQDYIRHVEAFAKFLGRSPDTATGDDISRFQLAQVEKARSHRRWIRRPRRCASSSPSRSAAPTSPVSWPAR
jgi:hypothetical protein